MSVELEETIKTEIKEPSKYNVILLNDNYTPVDFVVNVLTTIFSKTHIEAQRITEAIHKDGRGVIGVFTFEIAKTKLGFLDQYSKQNNFPLKGIMEKTDD